MPLGGEWVNSPCPRVPSCAPLSALGVPPAPGSDEGFEIFHVCLCSGLDYTPASLPPTLAPHPRPPNPP